MVATFLVQRLFAFDLQLAVSGVHGAQFEFIHAICLFYVIIKIARKNCTLITWRLNQTSWLFHQTGLKGTKRIE